MQEAMSRFASHPLAMEHQLAALPQQHHLAKPCASPPLHSHLRLDKHLVVVVGELEEHHSLHQGHPANGGCIGN